RIELTAAGLYPVLVTGVGLFSFGLAANLGGSGFLAVFLTGVVVGNSRFVFQRGAFLFLDGLAWLGQITMFVVLGLLI
ncbi:potassium/proton antiporter, partial [Acinetobacter baumannii]